MAVVLEQELILCAFLNRNVCVTFLSKHVLQEPWVSGIRKSCSDLELVLCTVKAT